MSFSPGDLWRLGVVLVSGAAAAWLTASAAWGMVAALAAWTVLTSFEWHELALWSRQPLTRPSDHLSVLRAPTERLFRSIRNNRARARRLAAELRRMKRTTDRLPDGWIVTSSSGEIDTFNQAAQRLLGLQSSDRRGNLVALMRDPAMVALVRGEVEGQLIECASPIDDGVRLELRRVGIDHDRFVVMIRDVTELNRLLTMRQDFIANVSHELRTPLTVIMGYLETLDETDLDADSRVTIARKMMSPANRMRALVDDLLTLTRLESAPLPSEDTVVEVDIGTLLETIVADARQLSGGQHDISLAIETDRRISGVAVELHSAFSNLVANAVRYSPGGGRIEVLWRQSDDGLQFSVRDHGLGIAPEHLDRLTERFYRIDMSGSRVRGGTGLGLAIVKHVLRRHQTALQVESELGVGSRFHCTFPFSGAAADASTTDVRANQAHHPAAGAVNSARP